MHLQFLYPGHVNQDVHGGIFREQVMFPQQVVYLVIDQKGYKVHKEPSLQGIV